MEFTGERYLSDLNSAQINYEHWHRYLYASQFVRDKDVLDIACGEGYGSHLLAGLAKSVTGVDISQEAVDFAKHRYSKDNLRFLAGSAESIPVDAENFFDVIVSFETIEHIGEDSQKKFMKEVQRLLKDPGVFLVSSPNKYYYSDVPNYKNKFHLKEFYEKEFKDFLEAYFPYVFILGQNIFTGSNLWSLEPQANKSSLVEYQMDHVNDKFVVDDRKKKAIYFIAVCSSQKLNLAKNSFLVDKSLSALSEKDAQIASAAGRALEKGAQLDRAEILLRQKQTDLAAARHELHGIYNSWKWKILTKLEKNKILDRIKKMLSVRSGPDPSPAVGADLYVPFVEGPAPKDPPARLIAFYLPQFHVIPENNAWWGDGFTDWVNVRRAVPQFTGHYQPHEPEDPGYYDLSDPSIQRRQVEWARQYGVGGFCFYFYWFGGKRLLEKPVQNYLQDTSLDLPFCLSWANENWSRRWDGKDREVLIAQRHSPKDDLAFIEHISQYLRDSRYIRIGGKPLLLVYRPGLLPSPKKTAERWRHWCRTHGIGEIYLAYTQSFETVDPKKYGFDAAIEFPPNNFKFADMTRNIRAPGSVGKIFDWQNFVKRSRNFPKTGYKLFRGVCPSWDNTPRRKNKGTVFLNSSPRDYQVWLENAVRDTCQRFEDPQERLIFVNAWNKWAEGAHLEPDKRYGYAWLDATRKALLAPVSAGLSKKILVVSHDAHPYGAQRIALNIVRSLKQELYFEVEVILLGGGMLEKDFSTLAPVHQFEGMDLAGKKVQNRIESLVQRGFSRAIVNTVVSGSLIPVLTNSEIHCISLVHELPGLIQERKLEKEAAQIASMSKAVVFCTPIVAEKFSQFASVEADKQMIRPQGLYRQNRFRFDKPAARTRLRERLSLAEDTKIVLGVGFADHRKGADLFVESALKLLARRADVAFVWVGYWEERSRAVVEARLFQSPYKKHFHFLKFDPDTDLYYAASDVYALTSREDPFPSVVLESFDTGVPVVAFASTGGGAKWLEDLGGSVIAPFDTDKFSKAVGRLLDDPEFSEKIAMAGQEAVDKNFSFRAYCFNLCKILGFQLPRISVVIPNYNYARFIEARLDSIRAQTIPIYEWIVLDDASTDESLKKITDWLFTTKTTAQVVVNRTNSGHVAAQWKKGLSLATGDYVWIAEADDLSDPDFLETVLPPLITENTVLSYCESRQIDSDGKVLAKNYHNYLKNVSSERWKRSYTADGVEEIRSSLAILNTIPNVSSAVFRRDAITAVFDRHFDEISRYKKAADWVAYLRVLAGGKVAFSSRPANLHRRHDQSVIAGADFEEIYGEICAIQQLVANEHCLEESVHEQAQNYRNLFRNHFTPPVREIVKLGDRKNLEFFTDEKEVLS